jgi:hypothetical protein
MADTSNEQNIPSYSIVYHLLTKKERADMGILEIFEKRAKERGAPG